MNLRRSYGFENCEAGIDLQANEEPAGIRLGKARNDADGPWRLRTPRDVHPEFIYATISASQSWENVRS